MSNTPQPKLRTKPPKLPDAAAAMKRLEALDEWTQKPARDAAAAIAGKQEEGAQPKKAAPVKAKAPAKKPPEQPKAAPWNNIEEGAADTSVKPMSIRLNMGLYKRLKWLGETEYGYDMTRIISEALEVKIADMLKARGIKP